MFAETLGTAVAEKPKPEGFTDSLGLLEADMVGLDNSPARMPLAATQQQNETFVQFSGV